MENYIEEEDVSKNKDKEVLKQFRKILSDVLASDDTDTILLKWLRAKNFNLRKSETYFRENKMMRQIHKVEFFDTIWIMPEVIKKYEFGNYVGIAKDGTPIHYVSFGRGDLSGFVMSIDTYDIAKYCGTILEGYAKRCNEQSKKLGREIHSVTFVVDMEGLNFRQIFSPGVLELGLDLFKILQDMCPEVWNRILIVNAPICFPAIFSMVKPIFSYNLMRFIQIVSQENTPNLLLKYIDAEVLPMFLGGKRLDSQGDPMCLEFMKLGDIIPEKYFLKNSCPPLLPTDPGVEEVLVYPRRCYNHSIVVHEVDSVIRIEVRAEGGSIPLKILFRKLGSDSEKSDIPSTQDYLDEHDEDCNVILVSHNVHLQAHLCPLNNFLYTPWPGIYIFTFDNSYNWLSSRRLIYRFRVLPPGSKTSD